MRSNNSIDKQAVRAKMYISIITDLCVNPADSIAEIDDTEVSFHCLGCSNLHFDFFAG